MKKIIFLFTIMIIGILFIPKVYARINTKWPQIVDRLTADLDGSGVNVTEESSEVRFLIPPGENKEYKIAFRYEENDNAIRLVPKDTTNLSDQEIVENAIADDFFVYYMIYAIARTYGVDIDKLDNTKLDNYGIQLTTREVSYTNNEDGLETKTTAAVISEFYVDLNQFELKTSELQGTFDENSKKEFILENPTVSLSLEKSNSTSLDLNVTVNNLPEGSTGKCEIYLMPEENTAFSTGESHVVGTIENCKNGNNTYTVPDLKPNSKYEFQIMLTYESTPGSSNQIVGDKYQVFSTNAEQATTTVGTNNNSNDSNNKEEEIKNPKKGNIFIYITLIALLISIISFTAATISRKHRLSDEI